MKNIDYLKLFFKKHNLSGRIKVKYQKPNNDDYMTSITFENGDIVNIHDIIFDIESGLPNDVFEQWIEAKREKNISLVNWMQSNNNYKPKIDRSSVEEYQKEMDDIMENVKESINKVFSLQVDTTGSDNE